MKRLLQASIILVILLVLFSMPLLAWQIQVTSFEVNIGNPTLIDWIGIPLIDASYNQLTSPHMEATLDGFLQKYDDYSWYSTVVFSGTDNVQTGENIYVYTAPTLGSYNRIRFDLSTGLPTALPLRIDVSAYTWEGMRPLHSIVPASGFEHHFIDIEVPGAMQWSIGIYAVPEPSCFLTLFYGLSGIAGTVLHRRRL